MDRDRNRGGGGGFGGDRKMYDATCSDCGQACQVPFEPKEGRPVYCRDCYKKHSKF
ncbi:MAG: CxxC-x17-CxxC domain-containing protein [Candidatus Micrarchaeota archaeon]